MTKRILTLMLALLLVCGASAQAESEPYSLIANALYRIVLRTEAEDVTLGSGVLFADQSVILTAAGCIAEGDLYAIGNDGEHAILSWEVAGDSGAALLEMATPSAFTPLALANYDVEGLPYVFGANREGTSITMPLYQALYGMYHGRETLLLSTEEGLLPGAFMADEKGNLVGLVVTQRMEGIGMYDALDPNTLYSALTGEEKADAFLDLNVSWKDGLMTVDWTDAARDGGLYIITASGAQNSYYTSWEAQSTARSIQLAVPPGYTYYIQAQWAENADAALSPVWSAMSTYTVPELLLTNYGFTQSCYLASVPAGQTVTNVLPEMTFISVDVLTDPAKDLYLQIMNTYDVSAEIECPMTLELIAPDGQFFFQELSYIFSPEYETADNFALQLDDLLATCAEFTGGGKLPAGDYKLRYAIAGRVAGEYAFTVQPAGTAAPASADAPVQENSGVLTGISAECVDGYVRVDWSESTVPEGATVTAYLLYDGNQYCTYYGMKPGETTADFRAVPGRMCMVWAAWSMEENAGLIYPQRETDLLILAPEKAMPYTRNGFTNLRCGVTATANPDPEGDGVYLPQIAITREVLTDPAMTLVFQTEDAYQVDAESPEHALTFALHTPEGYVFVEPGYYTFAPEFSASDLWVKDLSGIVESYASFAGDAAWPSGEYTFGYYIDGQVAAEVAFTLE